MNHFFDILYLEGLFAKGYLAVTVKYWYFLNSSRCCIIYTGGGGGIFAIMAYTGKLRSIGVGIPHQLSITYELSSSKKGGERGGGGLLRDLRYTCIHILKDVNKRGTFFVKNGMKNKR